MHIVKLIFISLLLQVSLYSLTLQQYHLIKEIYSLGSKFNLGLTMSAIVLAESNAGKYKITINHNTVDCGIFMINSKTLANDHWNQSRICERLILDNKFSFSVALKRFKYFYNYYRSKGLSKGVAWKRAIMSYHSGWDYKQGTKYYKKIVHNIKYINKLIKRRSDVK